MKPAITTPGKGPTPVADAPDPQSSESTDRLSGWAPAATALPAVALLLFLAADRGGYPATIWYPVALGLLGLLVVGLVALPAYRPVPRSVAVAALALAAYALWSYASIAWADERGDAWDGANRTALYAVTFALFALWPMRWSAATAVVAAFSLGVAGIGLVELLRAGAAENPADFFFYGRLTAPVGYVNASVALWTAAAWPCLALSARRELPALVRGACLGSAGLLLGLSLLGQSRGWAFALPVVALLFVAVTPGRVRAALALIAVVVAAFLLRGPTITVSEAFAGGGNPAAAVDAAVRAVLTAALALGALGTLVALFDGRWSVPPRLARRGTIAFFVLATALAVAGASTFVAMGGDPAGRVERGLKEFTSQATPSATNRFGAGLGSNRYDFWRVAWGQFARAPLTGVGADNFQQDYLERRRSDEEPRYPHSVVLRTLSQTGLVGAALLLVAIGAAALATGRTLRRGGPEAAFTAGAATFFAYWLVHGSIDWFWEFPGLAAPAFAMLGLAAGAGGRASSLEQSRRPRPFVDGLGSSVALGVVALALAASLAVPWVAERLVDRATAVWTVRPDLALADLERAAGLNPLSSRPNLVAGSIALRLGRLDRARTSFEAAARRDPRNAYAALELGAISSVAGRRGQAQAFLARARALDPGDPVAAAALEVVRDGKVIDITELNRRIRAEAQ